MLFQAVFVLCFFFIGTESFKTLLDLKIIGGTEVVDRSLFPYQAAIFWGGTNIICGASIINEKFVLTAAYCVMKDNVIYNPSDIKIVTGNLALDDPTIMKNVETIHVHEDYDASTFSNNIALIQISDSFDPWTEDVQPISLKLSETTSGFCILSGWGSTTILDGPVSNELMSLTVPVADWQTCNAAYLDGTGKPIPENTICAGEKGKASCTGDGGGPLVCSGQLAGVVSFAVGCAQDNYPGVNTKVAAYAEWIMNIILPKTTTTTSTTTTTPATTTTTTTTTPTSTTPDTTTTSTTTTPTSTTPDTTTTSTTTTPTSTTPNITSTTTTTTKTTPTSTTPDTTTTSTTTTTTTTNIPTSTTPDITSTTTTPCDTKGFAVATRDSVILWLLATVTILAIS